MKKLYLLVMLAITIICSTTQAQVLESDSTALVTFYNSVNLVDTTGTWLVKPVSGWYGVVVENNRVTELSTENLSANGTLPSAIGELSALTVLKLIGDEDGAADGGPVVIDIHGSLPAELWNLTNLTKLQIKFTNLTGGIPANGLENMTKLSEINFQQTYLGGEIPEALFNLPSLTKAYLHQSNFTGVVPSSVQNATKLSRLYLQDNQLDSVPFVTLTTPGSAKIELTGNYFSFATVKPYHDAASTFSKLTDDYQYAKAEDTVAVTYGIDTILDATVTGAEAYAWFKDGATSVLGTSATLTVSATSLENEGEYVCKAQSSAVSDFDIRTVYNLSVNASGIERDSLALVDFYNTANLVDTTGTWLVKPLASWYGVVVSDGRVTELSTENMDASGTLSTSLGKLTALKVLKLIGDEDGATDGGPRVIDFNGSLPENLWDLTSLEKLQIKFTNITGNIPTDGMENMTNLSEINFQQTYLGCEIPEELFNLPALTKAYLHQSNFTGNVPSSVQNATKLTRLYLQDNKLDSVPFVTLATPGSAKIELTGNYFSFATVKPYHDAASTFSKLTDDYQYAKEAVDTVVEIGSSFNVDGTVKDAESYAWFKDEETTPKASTAALAFSNFALTDVAGYVCKAQSSTVTDFYIRTDYNISLEGSVQDSLALVDFYNTVGLVDTTGSWLVKPLANWYGVVVSNGRVTELSTENLSASGTLSTSIKYLSALTILKLIGDEDGAADGGPVRIDINGSIPAEIWNLTNLEKLQVKFTNLTGEIPTDGLENMTKLSEINFQQTYLGCQIPEALFNLPALTKAYLHQSNFTGVVPSSVQNATNLTRLYLQGNKLDSVPFVDLSGNEAKVELTGNYFTFATVKPYHDAASGLAKLTDDYQFAQDTVIFDTVYVGDSVDFEFYAEGGESYAWLFNNTVVSTDTLYTFSPDSAAQAGTYTCNVQSSSVSDFSVIAAFVVKNVVDTTSADTNGINTLNSIAMACYPNPCNSTLTVKCESEIDAIAVFDITGKLVISQQNLESAVAQISVEQLNKGIYFVTVTSNSIRSTIKVIKN